MKALEARNIKHKEARGSAAGSTSKAPPPVLKRPASALVNSMVTWTSADGGKPRNNFTSKMYHQTKQQALRDGMSIEEAGECARAACRKAGEMYDNKAK